MSKPTKRGDKKYVAPVLKEHFGRPLNELVTASRTFPATARADLQVAVEEVLGGNRSTAQYGVHSMYAAHQTLTFADLMSTEQYAPVIAPLQHDEIDIGADAPVRCLQKSLWLGAWDGVKFAVVLAPAINYGRFSGTHIEVAVPTGTKGFEISRRILEGLETTVKRTGSYRGKVISLETFDDYSGFSNGIKVHKLHAVQREEVILPEQTLRLLDRNILDFIQQREALKRLRLPIKKGLLFYGAPGTGKTHTIHYLASHLADHTTLLVTAEQVGLLDHYFQLARFLQPAILVIEDVDLIARSRASMHGACEEALLNKLLNEMDGLREDAAILFLLTTNHPEHLEAALASRPGRIDQAIEFPLPDENGRRQLVRLYACGLEVSDGVVAQIVNKTENGSAAFIKELMRRCAQFHLQDGAPGPLRAAAVNAALEEMLFTGGTLNLKLLGVRQMASASGNVN